LPLLATPELIASIERREHSSEAHSISRLLAPRSIAVVGASAREGSVGHVIVRQLQDAGYQGRLHPVNRSGQPVAGLPATTSLAAIGQPVDLAIVAVPSEAVPEVVEDCGAAGVHGLVVISGGFAEVGAPGATRQRELVAAARRHGMRVIGPNCVGIVSTDPDLTVHATFGAVQPVAGSVALASQSGAVGIAVLNAATACGLGISSFVSLGNKADVSTNDLLQFWEDDPRTAVVLVYLESFGNPAKLARLARRIGLSKPIVAVKSGRTPAGQRAAGSHTAAMASDDAAVDALLDHCGVVRVGSVDEMLDAGLVLATQPLPAGLRLVIVGNSGGPGIMAADACAAAGLEMAELNELTRKQLRADLPPGASVSNPVDVLGDAGPDVYASTIATVMADDGVDMVVAIYAPTLVASPDDVASAIASAGETKPLVAVLAGRGRSLLTSGEGETRRVPVLGSVEAAIGALKCAAAHATWRRRPRPQPSEPPGIERATARALVDRVLGGDPSGRWLSAEEVNSLLDAYGISRQPTTAVRSRTGARAAAHKLGFPVALKATGTEIVHKTEIGGVVLNIESAAALDRAWRTMRHDAGASMSGGVIQPMAEAGVEILAGAIRDPTFGPLVVFGMGGTLAELLGDRCVRIAPLSSVDATEMVHGLRCSPLLTGYRGGPATDVAALEDLIVRVGSIVADLPEVAELDLNPVIATPAGVVAVDARVRLQPAPLAPATLSTARHLAAPRG
ncbi:MAG: acetate--CoA ligase family protein, partial [Acidimicrobiales bacterium]